MKLFADLSNVVAVSINSLLWITSRLRILTGKRDDGTIAPKTNWGGCKLFNSCVEHFSSYEICKSAPSNNKEVWKVVYCDTKIVETVGLKFKTDQRESNEWIEAKQSGVSRAW